MGNLEVRSLYILTFLIGLISFSGYLSAQLPPKNENFVNDKTRSLVEEVVEKRSGLAIDVDPKSVRALLDKVAELIDLSKRARQFEAEQAGSDASTTKRLDLLVEGFERLHAKISGVAESIAAKEFETVAEQLRYIAAMERAWSGKYNPEEQTLVRSAVEYEEKSKKQMQPFLAAEKQIQTAIEASKWEEVRKLYARQIAAEAKQLGANHRAMIVTLMQASQFEFGRGQIDSSIKFAKQAAQIAVVRGGKDHWEVKVIQADIQAHELIMKLPTETQKRSVAMLIGYSNLEHNLSSKTPPEATKMLAAAESGLGYLKKNLGEANVHYAHALHAIAKAYVRQDKFVEANYYFGLCTSVMLDLELEVTPACIEILNGWGFICTALGNHDRAITLFVRSTRASRTLYGEESARYLSPLENYGHEFLLGKAYEKALFVFEKVASLRLAISGTNDPKYRRTMVTIAQTQRLLDRPDDALSSLLKVASQQVGRPDSQTELDYFRTMGWLERARNDDTGAQESFEQAIAMSSRIYGTSHVDYAACLTDLASLLLKDSSNPRIGLLLLEAVKVDRDHLDRISQGQTELQHFRMSEEFRNSYFTYLTYAAASGTCDQSAYEQVLNWKGASFKERWLANRLRHSSSGASMRSGYDRTVRLLSNFATVADQVDAKFLDDRLLTSAIETKEDLWRAMAMAGQSKDRTAFANIQSIQAALPANGALVDFVQYNHVKNARGKDPSKSLPEARFIAAVLRKEGTVKLVPLEAVNQVEDAVFKWRKELQGGGGSLRRDSSGESEPAILRRMLWDPLESSLSGIESVIVCPDGFLSFLPWCALPGKVPGRYLIEDYAISTVPVAQFVARRKLEQSASKPVSMLLLGNPSYNIVPSRSSIAHLSSGMQFGQLPGTAKEVAEIADLYLLESKKSSFEAPNLAQGTKASEDYVRSMANKVRYIHLATHGFFRAEAWQSDDPQPQQTEARMQLRTLVPEVIAGIALAGANNSLAENWSDSLQATNLNSDTKDLPDDGILTALEVASMDLSHVDLVVLSACETNLGAVEIGEGSLGLQQSFQIAGARATISSQWKVDDSATQTLMVEFYRNLWEEKLPQGEALRQAQLSMLNRYDPAKQSLQSRGLKLVNPGQAEKANDRLQPFYWASFFLSGDWQ